METENPLSSSEREVTTEEILAVWNQIRTEVKLRLPKTEALLNSQKLIQMKNGTLILGFQSEVVRSKMENPENIELTRRVIYNLLHKDVAIECIVISGKGNGGGVDSSYESDSLVNAAIHLGGKLVHKD
jgi:DNA polymerase-3 subunit gamma/tau